MKILIIIEGFFPGKKYGGPPVSVDNFCSLMKEHECFIVTTNHDLFDNVAYNDIHEGWNNRDNSKVLYLSDAEYTKKTFRTIIEEIEPDILYLQGLFQYCVLPCLQLAKKMGLKVLLATRGELCKGALKIKRCKKVLYIEGIRILGLVKRIHWQSTSDEEKEAIKEWIKADEVRIHELENVPSIPRREYQRRVKNVGEGRFVYLSRIHPKKNLLNAIKYFHAVTDKVVFDIYGPIEDKEYWNQCMEEIGKLPDNVIVTYRGLVDHDYVHEVFSQYDAFLFPTFSENYGHVIAESLIVGTPVIISDQTPWNGIRKAGAGWAVPLTEREKFVAAINTVIGYSKTDADDVYHKVISFINNKFNYMGLKKQYESALSQVIQQ